MDNPCFQSGLWARAVESNSKRIPSDPQRRIGISENWDGDGPAGGCLTGPENLAKAVWPSIKPLCLDGLEFAAAIQKVPEIVHHARVVGVVDGQHEAHVVDGRERVFESKSAPVIPCRYSTELYPDISLLALPHAPSEMVRDMTIAILSLRNTAGAEWLTNVSHAGVDALLKELQLGPWAYLRDMSPAALYARHRTAFWLAAGLLLFLIFNELRLDRLVRRRTEDLRRSMAEQERLSAVAAATRTQLAMFERRSVVQQMSGMIAHEINAPVGAIRTWAALARIKCPTAAVADPAAAEALSNALSRIDGEATRIADIVSRVRKYARREHERVAICELDAIVESAVRAYRAEERSDARVPINVAVAERQAGVFGQPLELEVLVLNLVRNAASAVRRLDCLKGPEVAVGVELVRVADGRWRITVENPGPVLSAQVFEKLNARAEGLACEVLDGEADREISEGLGLGLTICRGIADSHGATLRFEARPEGGVRATVEIDAAGPAGEDTEGRKTMKVNEQGEDA